MLSRMVNANVFEPLCVAVQNATMNKLLLAYGEAFGMGEAFHAMEVPGI